MRQSLILFDVDGTLLVTGGASSRCIRRAAGALIGEAAAAAKITVGTLDPQIFSQLASACGRLVTPELLRSYRQLYTAELRKELAACGSDVKALPGARELIQRLSALPTVMVGLLTSNWREVAEMKLIAAGYDLGSFRVRAYAEDGCRRSDLVTAAMRRASSARGQELRPADVILVGDTPRDVACARETGCRVLSVATGHYSVDELRSHGPDAVVPELTNAQALIEMTTLNVGG